MKFLAAVTVIVLALCVTVALVFTGARVQRASATQPLDQLYISGTSLASGTIRVAVSSTGSSQGDYSGDGITLTYDTSKLTFSSWDATGSVLGGGQLCLQSQYQPGEDVVGCASGSTTTSAAGLLNTIILTPNGTGCVPVHILTLGPPDNADPTFGSATDDATTGNPQNNSYGPDVNVDITTGVSGCSLPATATTTPTATNSPTASSTPTITSTPTETPTSISGAPDVTVGLFASPTASSSGGSVTVSAFIANQGSGAAQDVTLQVTLPAGAVMMGTAGCPTYAGGSFYCMIGGLAASDGAPGGPDETIVTLPLRMPYSTTNGAPTVLAVVSASNEPAGNQGNNAASLAIPTAACPDFNGDATVNSADLTIFAHAMSSHTGQPAYNPLADINNDGFINVSDLTLFAKHWQAQCVGLDSDHDGLSNSDEINVYHTCPGLDPQFQGLPQCHVGGNTSNPLIASSTDTDGDGIPDGLEVATFHSDPANPMTSGDFYTDGQAVALGKNPTIYCAMMAADMNMNQAVNSSDLTLFAHTFGKSTGDPGYNPRADFNHDGHINSSDLTIFASAFNRNVSACP